MTMRSPLPAGAYSTLHRGGERLVEETTAGHKRIAADQPAVTEASLGPCATR